MVVLDTSLSHDFSGRNYIAVRKGDSVRNCIFGCWDDAKNHLAGSDCVWKKFSDLDDAVKYTFEKGISNKSTGIACTAQSFNIQMKTAKSPLENLSQDLQNYIYSFTCKQDINMHFPFNANPDAISSFAKMMGLVSRTLYQSCVNFVQQVPCNLFITCDADTSTMVRNRLTFFIKNRAKLGACSVIVLSLDKVTMEVFLIVLQCFDLSSMLSLNVPRLSKSFSDLYAPRKWDYIRILDRSDEITTETFFKEFQETLKATPLKDMDIQLDVENFYQTKLLSFKSLENLTLHLYRPQNCHGSANIFNELILAEKMKALMQGLPNLKLLKISSSLIHTKGLAISSTSLESLFIHQSLPKIPLAELRCPSLLNLRIDISPDSSLNSLISCRRTIEDLFLRCCTRGARMQRIIEAITDMPRLRTLELEVIDSPCAIALKSASLESISICGIGAGIQMVGLECPSIKIAEFTFDTFDAFDPAILRNSSKVLEKLSILCIDKLDEKVIRTINRKLDNLRSVIEHEMPNLSSLDLAIGDGGIEVEGTSACSFPSLIMEAKSKLFNHESNSNFTHKLLCKKIDPSQ